jgi:hypothetical protein
MSPSRTFDIRGATAADRAALMRLAALDSARPLVGQVLIAEVDGEPQAALEIATGRVVADPFRPTAHLVQQLQDRAKPLADRRLLHRRLRLVPRLA